jgi:hypothetical protein
MPVSDQNKLYVDNIRRWEVVRDCVEGSEAIKAARKFNSDNDSNVDQGLFGVAGSRYLPPPNPRDNSQDNLDRYVAYRERANFVNFTGHTKDGFMGMIGRRKAAIELQTSIGYIEQNANGAGLPLMGLIQRTISELLEVGRYGLLVDFPAFSEGGTQAQTKDLKATIKTYPTESIINWRETVVDYRTILTQVVLSEEVEEVLDDGFETEIVTVHRVLFIQDGIYKINLYDKDDELQFFEGKDGVKSPDIIPLKNDGSPWNEIPFVFVGSVNNDTIPDKAPLYDLAEINIAHYRNSADFEESSFIVGQPTPVIAGLTQAWVDDALMGGILLGSRTAILLPPDASASLLQANSNQMPDRGMELKEAQMIKVGAKVITDGGGVETAEAAKIRFAGQNSKLGLIVMNTEAALMKCFDWLMVFMSGDGENELDINKQFYDVTINPQLLVANMQLLDRGIIAKSDLRDHMRKSDLISSDRSDEDIDQEVGNIDPLG